LGYLDSFPTNGYWIFKFLMAIQFVLHTPYDFANIRFRYSYMYQSFNQLSFAFIVDLSNFLYSFLRLSKVSYLSAKLELLFCVVALLGIVGFVVSSISFSSDLSFAMILNLSGSLGGGFWNLVLPAMIYYPIRSQVGGPRLRYVSLAMLMLGSGTIIAALISGIYGLTFSSFSIRERSTIS